MLLVLTIESDLRNVENPAKSPSALVLNLATLPRKSTAVEKSVKKRRGPRRTGNAGAAKSTMTLTATIRTTGPAEIEYPTARVAVQPGISLLVAAPVPSAVMTRMNGLSNL